MRYVLHDPTNAPLRSRKARHPPREAHGSRFLDGSLGVWSPVRAPAVLSDCFNFWAPPSKFVMVDGGLTLAQLMHGPITEPADDDF
ncbi:MAG TPA: hypothetical protein VIX35_00550 [Vicinamibacterales bacterium]